MKKNEDIHAVVNTVHKQLLRCLEEHKTVKILTTGSINLEMDCVVEDVDEGISASDGINEFNIKENSIEAIDSEEDICGIDYYFNLKCGARCFLFIPN